MTYLELVNKVLVRMREDTVAAVADSSYSQLIGEFVQQATSEVEDAIDWVQLRTTVQITTVVDQIDYVLTGAGTSFNILGVHEDTEDYDLKRAKSYNWMNHVLLDNDLQSGRPEYFDINGQDANGDPITNLYQPPDKVYTINYNMKIKSVLSADSDSTPVPWLPIVLRAQMLAVEERGDDQGTSAVTLGVSYGIALADAVVYDRTNYGDEQIWVTV